MDFPPSSIIYLQQIYWEHVVGEEEGRGFTLHSGVILSESVPQYRCMNLPKTIEHIKIMPILLQYPIWTGPYCQCFFLDKVPHRSNWSHLFWNLEDPVLIQTLSYSPIGGKWLTTLFWLAFSINWMISMQEGCWEYLAFTCSSNSCHHSTCTDDWVTSPTNDINDPAELSR